MSKPSISVPSGSARHRISVNMNRLRTAHGLSQEKLGELADFHRTYVSQLERCVTNISVDGLERLAAALGVDVVELLQPLVDIDASEGAQELKFF